MATQSKSGVMLYRVLPLPDYLGFRVESWATTVTITRMRGSQDLLRRRRRTLEAITLAGLPVGPPLESCRKQQKQSERKAERLASRATSR